MDTVTIHTKISLVSKYFLDLVRGSQNLAGELRITPKYLENVFKLNKTGLTLLSSELNSKMAEMLKRWPKVATVKFTQISAFEKQEWLRNFCRTNFERDIFLQFKNLKDFQMAWNTKTLKEVSLSDFMEAPIQLNTSEMEPEKFLEYESYTYEFQFLYEISHEIFVNKIQYDSINVDKYDAIRDIRINMPGTETLKFMANRMKKLENFQMRIGFGCPIFWYDDGAYANDLLSKDGQKAFCDFLKSQEKTLTEINFLLPCPICHPSWSEWLAQWLGPTERILDYTKFIYESINKHCPNLNNITFNWLQRKNEFFPYPMVGVWKNSKISKLQSHIVTSADCPLLI